MPDILILTRGTGGDLLPLLPIGKALKARGHAVRLITHTNFEADARRAGLDFAPLPDDTLQPLGGEPLRNGLDYFLTLMRRYVEESLRDEYEVVARHAGGGEAVLVANHISHLVAQTASEGLGLPLVSVFPSPYFMSSLPMLEQLYAAQAAQINAARGGLGLAPVGDWGAWVRHADRSLALWPEWFGPQEPGWPARAEMVGFVHDEEFEQGALPAEVEEMFDAAEPPVLITHGTSKGDRNPFAACAEACRLLGRRGLIVTPHDELVPRHLPEGVKRFRYLPFGSVMRRAGAVVHHGGIGTSGQALAARVPQLVLPLGIDRPDNAARLQRLGVAETLPPIRWEADWVARSLGRLLGSEEVGRNYRRLAPRLDEMDAPSAAADLIEEFVTAGAAV
ncbi:MAG TPA: nucleotide disphospho-sugar-binding domain-containing protein [Pyrinomonadaceae bacterium]|jgi:UDP:flavonoid glycosyltransferase YjiC (YdhE family)